MALDPLHAHQAILGAHFVHLLDDKKYALFMDGHRPITKHALVSEFGTGNFLAARRLKVHMQALGFKSVMEFYKLPAAQLGDIKGFGTTMLYVLLCIARARGVNVKQWYQAGVTFDTLKAQALKEASDEAKDAKRRKKSRVTNILHHSANRRLKTNGNGHARRLAQAG